MKSSQETINLFIDFVRAFYKQNYTVQWQRVHILITTCNGIMVVINVVSCIEACFTRIDIVYSMLYTSIL